MNQRAIQQQQDQSGLKRVLIKFVGGMREPQEVFVGAGTSASDLLAQLGLERRGYFVSRGTPDSMFGIDENLYPSLRDGDLLYVSSQVDAGR